MLCGISTAFAVLFHTRGQVVHVLLTRSPLYSSPCGDFLVRLACVRHAASVDSEPGSNSHVKGVAGRPCGPPDIFNQSSMTSSGVVLLRSLWIGLAARRPPVPILLILTGSYLHALSSFQRTDPSPVLSDAHRIHFRGTFQYYKQPPSLSTPTGPLLSRARQPRSRNRRRSLSVEMGRPGLTWTDRPPFQAADRSASLGANRRTSNTTGPSPACQA